MSCSYLSLASVLVMALAASIFLPANVGKTRRLYWLPYLLTILIGFISDQKHCLFQDPWLAVLLLVFSLELISTTKRQPYFLYFLTAWAIAAASFLVLKSLLTPNNMECFLVVLRFLASGGPSNLPQGQSTSPRKLKI